MASSIGSLLSSSQVTSLIQQASAAFQLPAATLQTQEVPIKAQISALGKVQGVLSGLQSALSALADVQSIPQRTISAAPTGLVQATVTNNAPVGKYSLSDIQLAKAETLTSSGSSSSGSLGSGSIAIKVGTGQTVTVNITSGSSSLSGIATAIDQANAGVNASVLFDGTKYHLVLTGNATGTAKAFTVSGTGGLAGLSYGAGVSGGLALSQAAGNAGFSLNGISITSGSNKVGGVIPGVTLTLSASGSTTLTVSQTSSALDGAAQNVVQALNQVLSTINQETQFSRTSGGGPLIGNVGLELLRTSLINALSAPLGVGSAAGNTTFNSLSSVGFSLTSGGTVAFNDTAFQSAAQTNYSAVASLLGALGVASNPNVAVEGLAATPPGSYAVDVASNANGTVVGTVNGLAASGSTGGVLVVNAPGPLFGLALQIQPGVTGNLGTVTVSQGLFGSMSSLVNAALASGSGSVVGQIGGLNSSITQMNQKITELQKQATEQTKLLTAQFTTAQATLAQLSTVSSFLTSFFNQPSGGFGG
jgi:flagellar hook-associated protein 2